ncbi:MAG: UvrD-helicase domain-containing protein [Clostridiales bacterium]|jgi:DNA helicase-2/ATP-dependent DNA helicase PcrA|nr:UvrD-helicase domain-containing protein [Clostridiales bacterium]
MQKLDLSQLNEQQIKPVTEGDGQILVVAGAGSGKTRVLTCRIAYLIERAGVNPYNILAITFTNKAANEMKGRVNAMLGDDKPAWVSTFHSMCNRILRADIDKLDGERAGISAKNYYESGAYISGTSADGDIFGTSESAPKQNGIPDGDIFGASERNYAESESVRTASAASYSENGGYIYESGGGIRVQKRGAYDRNFSIYAESDVEKLLKRIIQNKHIEDKDGKIAKKARWHISNAKNSAMSFSRYADEMSFSRGEECLPEVFAAYEAALRENNALDFDDLLLKTLELLDNSPETLKKYSERFRHILIDEFQDTNKVQYELLKRLASKHLNIFAVGDDDQSIYGFRGADVTNMLNFKKDFPNVRIYKLERNYRSTGNILDAANYVIGNNRDRIAKKLWTQEDGGEKTVIKENRGDRDEADYVVGKIAEFQRSGYALKDIAVLVRQNSLTRPFEEKLNLYGIPYRLFGGFRFYERKEIKDVISYMRMISNKKDRESIFRIINFPKRGIGDALLKKIDEEAARTGEDVYDVIMGAEHNGAFGAAAKNRLTEFRKTVEKLNDAWLNLPLFEYVKELVRLAGFEGHYKNGDQEDVDRYENIVEFVNAVGEFVKDNPSASAEEFLQSVSLISDVEEEGGDGVILATVHSVKGLEFRAVFIVGVEEGIFPSSRSFGDESEIQEERRVMYVAMTRAKERLFVSYAKTRFRFNEVVYGEPSRFVKEMAECPSVNRIKGESYNTSYSEYGAEFSGGGYQNGRYSTAENQGGFSRGGYNGNYNSGEGWRNTFGRAGNGNNDFLVPERAEIERRSARQGESGFQDGYGADGRSGTGYYTDRTDGPNGTGYYGERSRKIADHYSESRTQPKVSGNETSKYKPGVKVFHKKFGEGTVVSVSGAGSETAANIAFTGLGVKKFNVFLAPLKIIEE